MPLKPERIGHLQSAVIGLPGLLYEQVYIFQLVAGRGVEPQRFVVSVNLNVAECGAGVGARIAQVKHRRVVGAAPCDAPNHRHRASHELQRAGSSHTFKS